MSRKLIKNLSASVHGKLLQRAKEDRRPFNELLQYYAMERFLYRWSLSSANAKIFVLKGALMLRVWNANELRPTLDIDMLGKTSNKLESITAIVKEVILVEVEPDGMNFDPDSVSAIRITEDADYEGVRVRFKGYLGNALIEMRLDVGFGDIVYPAPEITELPSMLNFPKAKLLCYSRESSIAEKFEAIVKLGNANSRMKDFFDIWGLSRQFNFEGEKLAEAVRLTFENRGTDIPDQVNAFKKNFVELKQVQWTAFHRRLKQEHLPKSFSEIVVAIEKFLSPVAQAVLHKTLPPKMWKAPGPWT